MGYNPWYGQIGCISEFDDIMKGIFLGFQKIVDIGFMLWQLIESVHGLIWISRHFTVSLCTYRSGKS